MNEVIELKVLDKYRIWPKVRKCLAHQHLTGSATQKITENCLYKRKIL